VSADFLLFALGLATQGAAAHTAAASSQPEKLSCSTSPVDKSFGRKKLWDGYEVSVDPTAHFEGNSDADDACTAAIYDPSGKEVYRTTGPGVMLDPATGMDVDGDGAPEVVLMNGSSGGGDGSWDVEVVSLKPQAHLLFKFDEDSPPAPFRKDSQGRVVLWSWQAMYLNKYYSIPNALARIYKQKVMRFTDGELRDVTAEYSGEIEKSPDFPRPTKNEKKDLKESKIISGEFENLDDQESASKVLSLIVQYIFCRRFQEALNVIREAWPEQDRANLIKSLQEIFKKSDCPECARQIEQWR
jgi:hypothetical protein